MGNLCFQGLNLPGNLRCCAAFHKAKIMTTIKLYSRPLCGWCNDAKEFLKQHRLPFEEVDVGVNQNAYAEMIALSRQRYVPTIVVNGHVLADFDVNQLRKFLADQGIETS
jgi:glutaredoxin